MLYCRNIQYLWDLKQLASFTYFDFLFPLFGLNRSRITSRAHERVLEDVHAQKLLVACAGVIVLVLRLALVLDLAVEVSWRHFFLEKVWIVLLHRLVVRHQIHLLNICSFDKAF